MYDVIARLAPHLADRYRLLHVAARGGMSVIVYGEDVRHERPVAIKVLSGEFAAAAGPERFLREIGILARLQHPHILPLLDSGAAEGMLYYVMPFVQGESLRQRIAREGKLPIQDTIRLLLEICDALRHAHARGLVHRDIKPENILIADRHALVADFGVARATGASKTADHTTAGMAIGTPAYMAPEQAAADPATDFRADIYSVGILAYEMLAGRPPFDSPEPAQVLAAHVTQPPPPLGPLRPELPPGLEAVIMRCLEKQPAARWQSASDLAAALEPYLLPSGSVTPVGTDPVARRKRRLWIGAAALGVAVLAAVARLSPGGAEQIQVVDPRRMGVSVDLELDPVLSPNGRLMAYAAGRNGSMRIRVRQLAGGDPIEIAPGVAGNQRWPRWAPDGERIAFQAGGTIYTVPALGGAAIPLVESSTGAPAGGFDWSPDGARTAYAVDGALWVRAHDGSGPGTKLVDDIQAHSPAWSPDGRWIAYVSGNPEFVFSETLLGNVAPPRLMLVPSTGGRSVEVTDGRSLGVSPVWLDERTVLLVQGHAGLRDVYRIRIGRGGRASGAPDRLTIGLNPHGITLSAGRDRVVYSVLSHVSNVWSISIPPEGIATLRDAVQVTAGEQLVEDMDVLPGAGLLLYDSNAEGTQDIWLMSASSGYPTQVTADSTDEFGPAWSPSGKEIAFYRIDGGVRRLFVMRVSGKGVTRVTTDSIQSHQPRWAPDGDHLVFNRTTGPGQSQVFTVSRNPDSSWSEPRLLAEEQGAGASWSPDGRWIAFADGEGQIRVVRPGGGPSRVVAGPGTVNGHRLRRPTWVVGEPALMARAEAPGGQGGIWLVPIDGSEPQELVRFDDPSRPVYRDDFAVDGDRVYFTISELSSGLWSASLSRR